MTIFNNASIHFNNKIPQEAFEKLREIGDKEFQFCDDKGTCLPYLSIEERYGDLCDELNEIVEVLKPYGVAPLVGEYNRYYGDYDGYDVFTGECFESMDDVDYGRWLARDRKYDDLIHAATELVDYFRMHNKNTTKAQDEKVENLREALDKLQG